MPLKFTDGKPDLKMYNTAKRTLRLLHMEALENRRLLAGVTLIAHGFNSNTDGWVSAMANATAEQSYNDVDQSLYRVDVTEPAEQWRYFCAE